MKELKSRESYIVLWKTQIQSRRAPFTHHQEFPIIDGDFATPKAAAIKLAKAKQVNAAVIEVKIMVVNLVVDDISDWIEA